MQFMETRGNIRDKKSREVTHNIAQRKRTSKGSADSFLNLCVKTVLLLSSGAKKNIGEVNGERQRTEAQNLMLYVQYDISTVFVKRAPNISFCPPKS